VLVHKVGNHASLQNVNYLYDINGNAAEWCSTTENKGKVLGGCAVIPNCRSHEEHAIHEEYTGFRVIKQ